MKKSTERLASRRLYRLAFEEKVMIDVRNNKRWIKLLLI